MRPNTARHERETSRTDRASWPLTPDALPWPTPGNEDAINSNPRLYGATRPTRTAGDGSYARAVPHVPHEQDPLAHLFPSPVSTVHLPDSHFAFTDRSGEVDKLYDHHADSRRQTPNWSYRKARAPVYYDVPHDLELHDDGSRMKRERSRSRSAHVRQDSGNGERARSTFDGITSPRLVPNDVHERRPFRSRITGREWKVGGGVLLVIVLCSVGGWAAWFFGTGQQNKA
ncbi:hypothetical protein JCM3775_003903 [Rhodotorula graminis]